MSLLNTLIPARARGLARRDNGQEKPTIKPQYELVENPEGFALTVYLPGVAKDGLEFTSENNLLRVSGRRAWSQPESWSTVYSELPEAAFELNLEHDHAIEIDKIHAELRDGVLRVSLPKAEILKPRKIAIS